MKVGLVFPGQGSQRLGMGVDLAETFDVARRYFDEASATLGYDMLALCRLGPEEKLRLTEFTQPAILTVSMAAYAAWHDQTKIMPACGAGHSLGEFSALVAAGALRFQDAVRLVSIRGRAMQRAVPVGEGGMAAVLGLGMAEVEKICADCAQGQVVSPANFNGPGQIVISGHTEAVARAAAEAKRCGAKRVVNLEVSAPFHCALMQPAAEELMAALENINVFPFQFPVFGNSDGAAYRGDVDDLRTRLVDQVTAPVRWEQCVQAIAATGVTHALECGPGKITLGLVKRIAPAIMPLNIETSADLALMVAPK